MMQIVLIGIGAGAAAALLFASVASGSLFSVILFYLAPLPIMIAAIGWSHWAALIAAIGAASGLALVFNTFFFLAFLIGVGLPAWWLGYLALLGRSVIGQEDKFEWYPAGRLVLWCAVLGALIVIAAIPNFGTDEESFRAGLRSAFERILRIQSHTPNDAPLVLPGLDAKRVIEILVVVIPLAAALIAAVTNAVNLWLAGRIVKMSGQLRRSWPDLPEMHFPRFAPAWLGVALAGSFLPNLIGTIASIFSMGLLVAYILLGLAVLHAITRGMANRGLVLGGTYVFVVFFTWPILAMPLIGLADTVFDIRGRVARKRGTLHPDPGNPE